MTGCASWFGDGSLASLGVVCQGFWFWISSVFVFSQSASQQHADTPGRCAARAVYGVCQGFWFWIGLFWTFAPASHTHITVHSCSLHTACHTCSAPTRPRTNPKHKNAASRVTNTRTLCWRSQSKSTGFIQAASTKQTHPQ